MTALTAYFDPTLWRDWFGAGVDQLGHTTFWFAVGQIVFINALLSGDNALVIAYAMGWFGGMHAPPPAPTQQ